MLSVSLASHEFFCGLYGTRKHDIRSHVCCLRTIKSDRVELKDGGGRHDQQWGLYPLEPGEIGGAREMPMPKAYWKDT